MALKSFTAQDQEMGPFPISGPFNVKVLSDPGGTILTLKESHEGPDGTYYTSYAGASPATFNALGSSTVYNYGLVHYKLVCTTYVATCVAGISSGDTV